MAADIGGRASPEHLARERRGRRRRVTGEKLKAENGRRGEGKEEGEREE